MKLSRLSLSSVTAVLVTLFVLMVGIRQKRYLRGEIIRHDVVTYYAYLPALFIHHDLISPSPDRLPGDIRWHLHLVEAPGGGKTLKMPLGVALLLLPFFWVAHLLALLTGTTADGYGPVYQFFVLLAAVSYLLAGLWALRKVLLRWFSEGVTAATLVIVVLATNLLYYAAIEPGMSHVYSFSLFAWLLRMSLQWFERPHPGVAFAAGLLAGLIVVVRPVNGLVLLVPLLYGILKYRGSLLSRVMENKGQVAGMLLAAALPVLLQMIYWKYSTGRFIFYSYGEERFFFNHPHILKGLFSYRKGWLLYTPVMTFALVGLGFWYKKEKALFWPLVIYLLLHIYVTFSWWCWWYGGSYGARPMVETYALLALPMAAFVEWSFRRRDGIRLLVTAAFVFFIFLNLFQVRQYTITMLHWDSTSKKLYWKVFLRKQWPEGYEKMLEHPDYQKALETGDE